MPPRYDSSKSTTTSQDSQHKCSSHQSDEPKESTAPHSRVQEDDYREGDGSLQSCKCHFDPSASLTHSLYNSNELLWKSISDFGTKKSSPISLSTGCGVYTLQAGRDTRIDIRMREDAQMMQLSAVVHNATPQIREMPSNKTRRGTGGYYMLLMTMMRFNSQLSRTACAARILTCDGQFILFQDMPVSVLNTTGMLHRKLDEFILKTVEIRRGFDRLLKEDHFR